MAYFVAFCANLVLFGYCLASGYYLPLAVSACGAVLCVLMAHVDSDE